MSGATSRVKVYWNTRKGMWSILDYQRGILMNHASVVHLKNVICHVSSAGRARGKRLGKKVVHAYLVGTIADPHDPPLTARMRYNPDDCEFFTDVDTSTEVKQASCVTMTSDRCVKYKE